MQWKDLPDHSSTQHYFFQKGVMHLICAQQGQLARALLMNFSYCMKRLQTLDSSAPLYLVLDYRIARDQKENIDFDDWMAFFRQNAHLFLRGSRQWESEKILLQRAMEQPESGTVFKRASHWLARNSIGYWVRQIKKGVQKQSPCIRSFEGHQDSVRGVISPAPNTILSWSDDTDIILWDVALGERVFVFRRHKKKVRGVVVYSQREVVSWDKGRSFFRWEWNGGENVVVYSGHRRDILGVQKISGQRLVSWSRDKTLRVWNQAASVLWVLDGHTEETKGVMELPSGRLVSWGKDKTLRIWCLDTGRCISILEGHSDRINHVICISPTMLCSCSRDKSARIWDLETGKCTVLPHIRSVVEAKLIAATQLCTRTDHRSMYLWNLETYTQIHQLRHHSSTVKGFFLLPDEKLCSWSTDNSVRICSLRSGKEILCMKGHNDTVLGARQLSGGRIVSWSEDKNLRIWSMDTGDCLSVLEGHQEEVQGTLLLKGDTILSWSGLDSLFTSSNDNRLLLWDHKIRTKSTSDRTHTATVLGTDFYQTRAISWSKKELMVWDTDTGTSTMKIPERCEKALFFDENRIVFQFARTVYVWNLQTRSLTYKFRAHDKTILGLSYVDDTRFLTCSADGTIRVWNIDSQKMVSLLEGHNNWVSEVYVIDPNTFLSRSHDKTLRLWSYGECVQVYTGAPLQKGAALYGDGQIISWKDRYLWLWNRTEGTLEGRFTITDLRHTHREIWQAWFRHTNTLYAPPVFAAKLGFGICVGIEGEQVMWHASGVWQLGAIQSNGVMTVYSGNRMVLLQLWKDSKAWNA